MTRTLTWHPATFTFIFTAVAVCATAGQQPTLSRAYNMIVCVRVCVWMYVSVFTPFILAGHQSTRLLVHRSVSKWVPELVD